MIKRVTPPRTVREARLRWLRAQNVVEKLEEARRLSHAFPHTRAYISRCLKSAHGAANHASRLHSELCGKERTR